MLEALSRRAMLSGLATLPFVGATVAIVHQAIAEHASIIAQIDAAEVRCRDAKQAFEAALAAYQTSFPRPTSTSVAAMLALRVA